MERENEGERKISRNSLIRKFAIVQTSKQNRVLVSEQKLENKMLIVKLLKNWDCKK